MNWATFITYLCIAGIAWGILTSHDSGTAIAIVFAIYWHRLMEND